MRIVFTALLLLLGAPVASAQFDLEASHTTASLRGIATAGPGIAWASGTDGTVLRTEDGGYLWQTCTVPPGAGALDFRGVQAFDAQTALAMASGKGKASRIFKTTDGCQSWREVLANPDAEGFFDALAVDFKTGAGYVLGDPVEGCFVLYRTEDAGEHWTRSSAPGLMAAAPGIGGFAASNTSLLTQPPGFATGGPGGPFFYRADRRGSAPLRMTSVKVPMEGATASSGIFSVTRADGRLVAVGGDYTRPAVSTGTAAFSTDDGETWTAAGSTPHGYRSAVALIGPHVLLAVGTNGADVSRDGGQTWQAFGSGPTAMGWNAIVAPYVVGAHGRIGKLRTDALQP